MWLISKALMDSMNSLCSQEQAAESLADTSINEHWGVFHEDVSGSYFANNAGKLFPKPAPLSCDSISFSCRANVLAWKPARNNVNNSSPRSSVKGLDIIPNRERWERAVVLA